MSILKMENHPGNIRYPSTVLAQGSVTWWSGISQGDSHTHDSNLWLGVEPSPWDADSEIFYYGSKM